MRRLFLLVLGAVCVSCKPAPRDELTVHFGMTAAELNAQPAMSQALRPARLREPDWLGLNGPLELNLQIDGHLLHIPVSEHGGVHLATLLGAEVGHPNARLSTIVIDVDPQPITAQRARKIAENLCILARNAGLRSDAWPTAQGAEHHTDFLPSVCWLQDETQSMQVLVGNFQLEPNGKFRVLIEVGPAVKSPADAAPH